jgi:hypothetical protein
MTILRMLLASACILSLEYNGLSLDLFHPQTKIHLFKMRSFSIPRSKYIMLETSTIGCYLFFTQLIVMTILIHQGIQNLIDSLKKKYEAQLQIDSIKKLRSTNLEDNGSIPLL